MAETPLFFPNGLNGHYSLFGVLHEPDRPTSRRPFVMVHPFGEEKLWAHRVFVTFARQLAAAGHVVLRFDCMGSGDSDGDSSVSSVETVLSDIDAAVTHVRTTTQQSEVGLIGLRLGATAAALAADRRSDIRPLVLWAPIVDGARYLQELLRINLTTQMATHRTIRQDREAMVESLVRGGTVNVDGYEIGHALFSQASAINLARERHAYGGPCLVVQVDRKPEAPVAPELEGLGTAYPHATVVTVQEEPFWKEIAVFYNEAPRLFAVTADWLQQNP